MMASSRQSQALFLTVAGLGALVAGGCELGPKNILAPSDATISLSSTRTFLAIGETTLVTVTLTALDGSPVGDGTEVLLTASLGQLDQGKLRVKHGQASVTYRAGTQVGQERLRAESGSVAAELAIAIGSAAIGRVVLAAEPAVLPPGGGEALLTATVFSAEATPVSGVPVTFEASAGTLSPAEPVFSAADGTAQARLQTTTATTVRALTPDQTSGDVTLSIRAPVTLTVSALPLEPTAGQAVTFTVTATVGSNPATGQSRLTFGDGQSADLGQITGTATTTYTYPQEGGYNVTAHFTEAGTAEIRSTIRVEVRAAPPAPPPLPPPAEGVDQIDPRSITWLSPASTDVSGWAITSQVTDIEIAGHRICIYHTKAGRWPLVSIDDNPPNIEGNPMIVANINGQWYGAGFDWFGEGRVCKNMAPEEYGRDQIRVWPLDASWPGPQSGDLIGLLVSTPSSDRIRVRSVNERSNIVLVRWP